MSVVPEAARAQAEDLLQRWIELQGAHQEQETAWLQAYISALEGGESISVAAAMADGQMVDSNLALARRRDAFRSDLTAFVMDNPEAVIALAILAHDIHTSASSEAFFMGRPGMGRGAGFHSGMMVGPEFRSGMHGADGRGMFFPGAGPGWIGPWMQPGMMDDFDGNRLRERLSRPEAPEEEPGEPDNGEN